MKKKKVYKDFFFLCCLFLSLTKWYLTHWTVSFHLMRTNLRCIDKFVAGLIRGIDDWFDDSAWNLVSLHFTLFYNIILYYIGKWKTWPWFDSCMWKENLYRNLSVDLLKNIVYNGCIKVSLIVETGNLSRF